MGGPNSVFHQIANVGEGAVTGALGGGLAAGLGLNKLGSNLLNGGRPPSAPNGSNGSNANLSAVQQAQLANAQSFRQNIPNTEAQLGSQLAQQTNNQMGNAISQTRSNNSARGLLYGGVNAGQEQGIRNQAASNLAQGQSNINANTQNAAFQLDQEAANTGFGIQQSQQAIQNDIYSQALANMNAASSGISSLLGAGGKVVGGMLGKS